MLKEQMRELLLRGYCTHEVEIAGLKFKFRTLRGKDLIVVAFVRENYIASRPQTTLDTFVGLDTAIKLALALIEIGDEPWLTLTNEEINFLVKSGFVKDQTSAETEKLIEKAIDATLRILEFPPQLIEKLSNEYNNLNTDVQKAIESGEVEKN